MSSGSVPAVDSDFCAIAVRLKFLRPEEALQLQSASQAEAAAQAALRLGLLDVVEIDTIEVLRRPTETIPGYEVLDLRGRGGMGVVYRARQTNLGRIVALKTLLVSRMADASFLTRFEQEARTLAQLRHPNVVSIFDFGRTAGRVYLAMEFIDGADADALVRNEGPLPERVAWGLARQVAAGLAHGDAQGVVHRDIKPANLLLVPPPEGFPLPAGVPLVKIADFGLAILADDGDGRTRLTADNATVGSPHYMAPEQFQGSRVDRRADMYSLGASVYELLTGQAPFGGCALPQIIGRKLTGGPEPLENLRPDLALSTRDLVSRLMARNPDERPDSYSAVLRGIDDVLTQLGEPAEFLSRIDLASPTKVVERDVETRAAIPHTQAGLKAPKWRPPARSRRLIGALCLLGAVGLGFALWGGRPLPPPVRPSMVEAGDSQYLFNGTSMSGWTIVRGEWNVPPGDAVIAGSSGQLARDLSRTVDGRRRAPEFYRLLLAVQLHEAEAAAVLFGVSAPTETGGAGDAVPRYALRLTADAVTMGPLAGDATTVQPTGTPRAMSIGADMQHAVAIERLPNGWFVSVDGTDIGFVPLQNAEVPQVRLSAHDGTAWFSDLELVELRPQP